IGQLPPRSSSTYGSELILRSLRCLWYCLSFSCSMRKTLLDVTKMMLIFWDTTDLPGVGRGGNFLLFRACSEAARDFLPSGQGELPFIDPCATSLRELIGFIAGMRCTRRRRP